MNLSHNARKGVAIGLAASTVLMTALTGLIPAAFAAAHAEGCLVLSSGTVYMVTGGQLRGFPSADVFTSHGNGFGGVQQANAEDLALPMGAVLVYADGTLVKGPNDPLVYLVANGQKRGFTTGAVFTGLGFKFSNIQSAPANTFADLPTGANLDNASERHTTGVWIIDSTGTVWRMTATGRVGLPTMAVFNSWGKSFATVVSANSADMALANEGTAAAKPSCTSTTPPTGPMSVTTSGPAASTLIETSVANNLADFNFSGSGAVTTVTFERTGVSTNSTLSNVYLFDGSTRLTDAYSFGSDNKVTMSSSSLFSVSGSKTVSLRADVASATAGQSIGVKLTSYNGNAVSVQGNSFSIAANPGSGGLATASFGAVTPSGNIDPGNDLTLWQSTLTVSGHDTWFNRLSLRKIGSINNSDVNNFKLFIDGVQQAASSSLNADGYVTFTPASPVKLTTTGHVIRVAGDIIGGSTRTLRLSLRNKADIGLTDSNFSAGIAISTAVPLDAGTDLTVTGGTFTVVKAGTSASGNIVKDATDVSLGKWTVTTFGEPVKVETLNFGIDVGPLDVNADGDTGDSLAEATAGPGATALDLNGDGDTADTIAESAVTSGDPIVTLRSVRVLVNGSQVGATTSVAAENFATVTETGNQFTINSTIQTGAPITVELRGDIYDNEGSNNIAATTTIKASMLGGDFNNGTYQNSLTITDIPATATGTNTDANTLTVQVGSMALTKQANYTNQTTTVPQTTYALAKYNLTGNSSEDVNVTSISIDLTAVSGATFTSADITNMYVKYGSQTSTIKSSVAATANSYSVSFTLAKNSVVPIEIYGNIGTNVTNATDSIKATTTITGTTVGSATSVNTTPIDGQTIIYGAGVVATAVSGSTPVAAILYSNQNADVAQMDVITTNDAFTVTELQVKFLGGLPTTLTTVSLKDGGTVLMSQPAAATVTFTGLSIPVGANVTKTLTAAVTVGNVGSGAGATGEAVTATFDNVKTINSQGTEATDVNDRTGSAMYAYKAVPQIDAVALPTTVLSNGNVTLQKFQVQGMGGTIGWKKIIFTFTKTTGPAITTATVWDVTASTEVTQTSAVVTTGATGDTAGVITFIAANEQQISTTHVYELRADIATSVSGNSVSTKIASGTGYAASNIYSTVAGTAANVVWTDRSLNGHAVGTADWTNEYAMKTLPTTTQTLSR